jgi:hypothetical protein
MMQKCFLKTSRGYINLMHIRAIEHFPSMEGEKAHVLFVFNSNSITTDDDGCLDGGMWTERVSMAEWTKIRDTIAEFVINPEFVTEREPEPA